MPAQTDCKTLRKADFPGWGGELEPVPEFTFIVRALLCWMGFFPLNWLVWTLTGHWTLQTKAGKLVASFHWSPWVGESKVPLNSPLWWEKSQLLFVLGRKKKLDIGYHQCLSGKINLLRSSFFILLTGGLADSGLLERMDCRENSGEPMSPPHGSTLWIAARGSAGDELLLWPHIFPSSMTKEQGNNQSSRQQKGSLGNLRIDSSHC